MTDLEEKLREAEMRLRLIAKIETVKDGKYILHAGAVMRRIAEEYFRMFDKTVPDFVPIERRREYRLLMADRC